MKSERGMPSECICYGMKKVLVFGTFDIFHEGHRHFLKEAKKHGNHLRVIVARDATVETVKKRSPLYQEEDRVKAIAESGLADEVMLGSLGDKYEVVGEYKPDIICLGYDQGFFIDGLAERLADFGLLETSIVRLEAFKPEMYKSSILRESMVFDKEK